MNTPAKNKTIIQRYQTTSEDPFFYQSLLAPCVFSFALTIKNIAVLSASNILKFILQNNYFDFENERTLCKEKFSALSKDFENIFIKKFLKRQNELKKNFTENFCENFKIAQNIFSQKRFPQNIFSEPFFETFKNQSNKIKSQEKITLSTFKEKDEIALFNKTKDRDRSARSIDKDMVLVLQSFRDEESILKNQYRQKEVH